ncbi:MAG: class I SAM-dependent methyltransferase [Saprospiraceae bacterium]|nr:class I SAM-dependent methyltransferase [Saprospiraceae bacterium]
MKKLIKSFLPDSLINWYRITKKKKDFKFRNLDVKDVFTEIYNTNYWSSPESISGGGSEINQTTALINGLNLLLSDLRISTILDLPCGDFNWMQKVDLTKIDYLGADIVEELIKNNIKNYNNENRKFVVLNLITDPLPQNDLIIVRDCLVHLSYKDIYNAIKNIKSSGSKYLLTTTFTNHDLNHDIVTGDWRAINLQKKPFNFSSPLLVINENCTQGSGEYSDKAMALWEIDKI